MKPFTLTQFDYDGTDAWSSPSTDLEGVIMEFATWEDAVGMARFIVEDPSSFPLVGIDQSRVDSDGEHVSWSAGWTQREANGTITVHDGDYENDADWEELYARAGQSVR